MFFFLSISERKIRRHIHLEQTEVYIYSLAAGLLTLMLSYNLVLKNLYQLGILQNITHIYCTKPVS